MSQAIIYGLVFSTALTLVFTPCMLMARERVSLWRTEKITMVKRLVRKARGQKDPDVVPPLPAE
jgi:hypothetical protein